MTANRILIQKQIFDQFVEKFIKAVENLKVGPGLEDLDVAAMINDRQVERVSCPQFLKKNYSIRATYII